MNALGLRYFNVYGPRQDPQSHYAGVISRFAARIAAGEQLCVFGDGLQTRDFVHVADVARTNLAALGSSVRGVINVGTGVSISLLELIDTLARCGGRAPDVRFDPPVTGDIRLSSMNLERMRAALGVVVAIPLVEGLKTLL